MKRYHCPQWCHRQQGWIDLESIASVKEKEAIDAAESFSNEHPGVRTRVIRKPKGWIPNKDK